MSVGYNISNWYIMTGIMNLSYPCFSHLHLLKDTAKVNLYFEIIIYILLKYLNHLLLVYFYALLRVCDWLFKKNIKSYNV